MKKSISLLCAATFIATLQFGALPVAHADTQISGAEWEYMAKRMRPPRKEKWINRWNEMGQAGWELVGVNENMYIFKRIKPALNTTDSVIAPPVVSESGIVEPVVAETPVETPPQSLAEKKADRKAAAKAKKEAKKADKEQMKAEKKAKKEQVKAQKAAEKEAKKAERDAEKAQKAKEKEEQKAETN